MFPFIVVFIKYVEIIMIIILHVWLYIAMYVESTL
jgi:hypothetical protein